MPTRPCLVCGALSSQGRCEKHRRQRPWSERTRRAQAVEHWRATYGDVCPGWQRPPHHATDLTADHVVAVAVNGDERGELAVMCRACNSRKGSSV